MLRCTRWAVFGILLGVACTRSEQISPQTTPGQCSSTPRHPLRLEPSISRDSSVRGRVFSSDDGIGLAQARILLLGSDTTGAEANAEGEFVIGAVPPGRYEIEVRRIGFRTRRDSLHWRRGAPQIVFVPLDVAMLDGPCGGFAVPASKP